MDTGANRTTQLEYDDLAVFAKECMSIVRTSGSSTEAMIHGHYRHYRVDGVADTLQQLNGAIARVRNISRLLGSHEAFNEENFVCRSLQWYGAESDQRWIRALEGMSASRSSVVLGMGINDAVDHQKPCQCLGGWASIDKRAPERRILNSRLPRCVLVLKKKRSQCKRHCTILTTTIPLVLNCQLRRLVTLSVLGGDTPGL